MAFESHLAKLPPWLSSPNPAVLLSSLVAVTALALLVLQFYRIFVYPKLLYRDAVPGPPIDSWVFGNVWKIEPGQFHKKLYQWYKEYGRTYQIWLMHRRTIIVTDLQDVRYVTSTKNLPKADLFINALKPMLKEGLLTTSSEKHPAARRAMGARFNTDFLRDLHVHICECMKMFIQVLDEAAISKAPLDFDKAVTAFALNVICRAAFGAFDLDFQSKEHDLPRLVDLALRLAMAHVPKQVLVGWMGKYGAPQLYEVSAQVHQFAYDVIETRKNETEEKKQNRNKDLLDIFLSIDGYTKEDIAAEIAVFLFAGHDTTSHSLAWLMYEVAQQPEIELLIVKELEKEGILVNPEGGASTSFAYPTFEHIKKLDYVRMVWNETLRKRPVSATGTYRTVTDEEGVLLPGSRTHVEKGTDLLLPPYLIHRDPEVWGDHVEEFDPMRFSKENAEMRNAFAVQTFSSGPRNCIGQFFAIHEAMVTVATLFARYKFQLACAPEEVIEFHSLTMRPRCKKLRMYLPVIVEFRDPAMKKFASSSANPSI